MELPDLPVNDLVQLTKESSLLFNRVIYELKGKFGFVAGYVNQCRSTEESGAQQASLTDFT